MTDEQAAAPAASDTIDAYCHCGISKYRPVEDVHALMASLGVERAVLVQHFGEFDNGYLSDVVAAAPERFRAVALLDHDADYAAALDRIAASPQFAAVRIPEPALLSASAFATDVMDAGLAVVLDLPSGVRVARERVAAIAQRRPEVPVVISHLGYPTTHAGGAFDAAPLLALAQQRNVHVMLSGFSEVARAPYAELREVVAATLAAFGAGRMLWGSDFPVAGDAGACAADLAFARSCVADAGDQRLVFGGSAARIYFARART